MSNENMKFQIHVKSSQDKPLRFPATGARNESEREEVGNRGAPAPKI